MAGNIGSIFEEPVEIFTKNALKNVVKATRAANAFPQEAARDLYCAYPTYGKIVDQQSNRILKLISRVLKTYNIKDNIQRCLQEEQFEMVQECNDIIFEHLGSNLDTKAGLRLKQQDSHVIVETEMRSNSLAISTLETPNAGSWNQMQAPIRKSVSARLITAKNIERPQAKFKELIDNSALTPFMPKLKEKPNSLKPLAILPEYDDSGNVISYLHPYDFELSHFEPSVIQLEYKKPTQPKTIDDTDLVLVDNINILEKVITELQEAKEIAVDVEHHSYRTFMGITCLVQISTKEKDYIFDTLALRSDMHLLNLILTDPKILKVFHGAESDIEWLQRDLSIYVVNMFDTHKAAKKLNMARLSLAFLLKHYVNIDVDKTFQLADWRMRPLPKELINYARQDTHYLIYIYEHLTNALLDVDNGKFNSLRTIYQQSTEVCKKRYVKPHIGEDSHISLLRKSNRVFDNRQMSALYDLFRWRDEIARKEDESYGYVLPNHMMLQIAESLPREMQGILACCNPIPPPVRQQLHKLHDIVLTARDQPLVKCILDGQHVTRASQLEQKIYIKKLYCPLDLSHMDNSHDDLPTLLNIKNMDHMMNITSELCLKNEYINSTPSMALFEKLIQPAMEKMYNNVLKTENRFKRNPYKRYLAILPYVEKEKQEEALRMYNEKKSRLLCSETPIVTSKGDLKTSNDGNVFEPTVYSLPLKEQLKRKYHNLSREENCFNPTQPKRLKSCNFAKSSIEVLNAGVPKTNVGKIVKKTNVATEVSTNNVEDDDSEKLVQPVKVCPNLSKSHQLQTKNLQHNSFKDRKNFNYDKVDFKQFRGGAQRVQGAEHKSAPFHAKNQSNKINKQFNKLFTFSNVKTNK